MKKNKISCKRKASPMRVQRLKSNFNPLYLLGIILFITSFNSFGQLSTYSVVSSSETYSPLTSATDIVTGSSSLDSYVSSAITIPSVNFYGVAYTTAYVTSNGFLNLGGGNPSSTNTTPISTTTGSGVSIAPMACDLDKVSSSTKIRWEDLGTYLAFEWVGFKRYGFSENFDFQIRIEKTTGQVIFSYNLISGPGSSTSYQPQVGIRTSTTNYKSITVDTGIETWANPNISTSNASKCRFTSSSPAKNFTSGQIYTFNPPTPCSGTPTAGTIATILQNVCVGSTPSSIALSGFPTGQTGIVYQWQESATGTPGSFSNVTTGTGATTTSYTPAAFSGTPIYYACQVSCTNSSLSEISNAAQIDVPTNPTTQVSNIASSSISYSGFGLNWTNGNGNRRVVVLSNVAIVDPTNGSAAALAASSVYSGSGQQIIYDGTSTSVSISGLNCNTLYYAKVYEYKRCGSGPYEYYYNTSSGTNAITVTTASPTLATLPVLNNFTGFTGSNLSTVFPGWYTGVGASAPSGSSTLWGASAIAGFTTAKVNLFSNTKNEWIVSPKVTLSANSRFVLDAAITNYNSTAADPAGMQGTDDKVEVKISTDGCGAAWTTLYTYNAANTTLLSNSLTTNTIDLTAYTGMTVQIGIFAKDGPIANTPDYDFHVGNLKIELIPSCDVPVGLVTNSIFGNVANISWTASASNPVDGYEYYYSTSNTAPDGSTVASGSVGFGVVSASLSGLNPQTQYYFWVRSMCSTPSAWSLSATFTTTCSSISSFPYTETFDVSSPTLSCWTASAGANSLYQWAYTTADASNGAGSPAASTRFAYLNVYNASISFNSYNLLSPPIELDATNKRLKYKYFLGSGGYTSSPVPLALQISVNGGAFTTIYSHTSSNSTFANSSTSPWQENTIDLSSYAGSSVKFRFVSNSNYGSGTCNQGIDEFLIEDLPSCVEPTALVASNIASNSATISWTASTSNPVNGYDYYYSTSNTAPDGSTVASGSVGAGVVTANLNSLTPETQYYFWVRSMCGAQNVWSVSATFTTACVSISSFPWTENFESATTPNLPSCWTVQDANLDNDKFVTYPDYGVTNSKSAGLYTDYNSGSNNDYLILPNMTLTGNERLKFYVRARSSSEPNDYRVVLSTTGTAPADFTTQLLSLQTVSSTTMTEITPINLSAYTGNVYIAIHVPSGGLDGYYIYFDNFTVETIPSCESPTALTASSITPGSATISWTASTSNPANGYEYYFATSNTAPDGSTVASGSVGVGIVSAALTGLSAQTSYYFWVRSLCNTTSPWSAVGTFTTACSAISTFSENFDLVTNPNIPDCWGKIFDNGASTYSSIGTGSIFTSTPNGVIMYNSSSASTSNIILVSPYLSNLGAGTHRLKFKGKSDIATQDIIIGTLSNPSLGSTFTPLDTVDLSTTFSEYLVNFNNYNGTDEYIGFRRFSTYTYSYVYLDDIDWELAPACLEPSTLSASNISSSGASLGWVENGSATNWNIEYGVTGFTQGTGTIVSSSSNPYTVGSLNPTTSYDFYVQSDCGGDVSSFAGPFTFTTECLPISAFPWIEDFESNPSGTLPTCWTANDANSDLDFFITYPGYGVNNTNTAGLYTDNNGGLNNDYLILPKMTLTGNQRLKFSVRARSGAEPNDYRVVLSTTGNTPANFTNVLLGLQTVSSTTMTEISPINLASYTGDVYIAIHVPSGGLDGWYIYFDDFVVEPLPSCVEPSALTLTNATTSSLTFDWSAGGAETSWNLEYGPTGFTPGSGTLVPGISVSEYTISGLSPNTNYSAIVQAICGGSTSAYTTSVSGYTGYCISMPTSNDGTGIQNVSINSTDYTTGDVFYFDHSGTTASVNAGVATNVDITFGTGSYQYTTYIYIDTNNNLVYDANELFFSGTPSTGDGIYATTVTLPSTLPVGNYNMRILAGDGLSSSEVPCYNGTYAVTLDFTINNLGVQSGSGIAASDCGSTISMVHYDYFHAEPVVSATEYEFRISNNSGVIDTVNTGVLDSARFSDFVGYQYNSTYSVDVRTKVGGVWSPFGPACNISIGSPVTSLQNQCGTTLPNIHTNIFSWFVPLMSQYYFEVSAAGTVIDTVASPTRFFSLANLAGGASYGSTYSIRVALNNAGVITPFGTSCNVSTPSIPTTQLRATNCGITVAYISSNVFADQVPGATNYRFKVTYNGESQTHTSSTYFTSLANFNLANSTTYDVQVAVEIGGSFGAYGSVCTITTPAAPTSQLRATQCGTTMPFITSNIFADIVPGASNYKFRVTNNGTSQTFTSTSYFTSLANFTLIPSTTYSVDIAVEIGGTFGAFGSACNITTPAAPTTQLRASQCGATLPYITSNIFANIVSGATNYKFRITHNGSSQTFTTNSYFTSLANFNMAYGTTYDVDIAVEMGGVYGAFGTVCTITTPAAPTSQLRASNCGVTVPYITSNIFANIVTGATSYKFRVTNNGTSQTFTTTSYFTSLANFTLANATTYDVDVAIELGGVFGPYGSVCTITTPPVTPIAPGMITNDDSNQEVQSNMAYKAKIGKDVVAQFDTKAYPNPFGERITLDMMSDDSETPIVLSVIDATGRIIETKVVNLQTENSFQFGENYLSGVYQIVVTQNQNVKIIKVVKK